MSLSQTWFVTGGSQGLGLVLADHAKVASLAADFDQGEALSLSTDFG